MYPMNCAVTKIILSDARYQKLQNELNFVKIELLETDLVLELGKSYCAIS